MKKRVKLEKTLKTNFRNKGKRKPPPPAVFSGGLLPTPSKLYPHYPPPEINQSPAFHFLR